MLFINEALSFMRSYSSSSDEGALAAAIVIIIWLLCMLVSLAVVVVIIVALWKLFKKAGKPGWAAIIPFYNSYILCETAFGNGWYFLFMFIPILNWVLVIYLYIKIALVFGKGIGFAIGTLFLPIIFLPILAFGSAEYDETKAYLFK